MINLRILFGLIPKTAAYEAHMESLRQEYQDLLSFSASEELKEYLELEKTVNSQDFKLKKKSITRQKYSDTQEYKKEKEYLTLKKSGDIKRYYQTKDSVALKDFLEFDQSYDLKHFHTLEKFVQSEEFLKAREYARLSPKERFRRSDFYKTLQQYLGQKSAPHIRDYYKLLNSKAYGDYARLHDSETLLTYQALHEFVNSPSFSSAKHSMKRSEFRNSQDYQKLQQYKYFNKSSEIRNYKAILQSPLFANFKSLHGSKEIEAYEELEKYVLSGDFKMQREKIERHRFEDTPEFKKLDELNALKKSQRIKDYFAFKSSKDYLNFTQLIGSEKITAFEELEKYVHSDEFWKVKEYMLLPGNKKLELSEEYRMEQQYLSLKKSEKFQWYFRTRDSRKFNEIKRWKLAFSDEFETGKLDRTKWLTRYFWGESLLHDSYSNDVEMQFLTDGQNIEIANSVLKIHTKREKIRGKSWNPAIGFYPRDFEFTSGIINSGGRFRQQYGLFEAKIRFNHNYPVNHAFWMISDLMLPHIDIAKASKRVIMGSYWGNPNARGGIDKRLSALNRSKFERDFFIFSLEWTKEKLTWKVNGVKVLSATEGVPHVPMYMNLSSSLYVETNGVSLPAEMEVDWVRCYQAG
jgi:hypothetical protein